MLKSMTGFGKATCELGDRVIAIEIKSLNSKQLDIFTRVPQSYREKDIEIRNMLSNRLERGKVELNLTVEVTDAKNAASINLPVARKYYEQLKQLAAELGSETAEPLLATIMRLPETLKIDRDELNEDNWNSILKALEKALDAVDSFRLQEGKALKKDMLMRLDSIEKRMPLIEPYEKERVQAIREKMLAGLKEYIEPDKIDSNRFEQELIYYFEKLDISEEKVRLQNHCRYFREVIESPEGIGKKLGFIAQEMGREINTLGSKASHHEIQKLVVEMKDELEKIKEQVLNIL